MGARQRLKFGLTTLPKVSRQESSAQHFRAAFANTGCCCWENGHISALEIAGGDLAIVTWERDDGGFRRREHRRTSLLKAISSTIGGIDDAAWEGGGLRVVVSD